MDILSPMEIEEINSRSLLIPKYNRDINRDSAQEILQDKLDTAQSDEHREVVAESARRSGRKEKGFLDEFFNHTTTRQIRHTVAREVTRSILGVLGLGGSRRRS